MGVTPFEVYHAIFYDFSRAVGRFYDDIGDANSGYQTHRKPDRTGHQYTNRLDERFWRIYPICGLQW
ncbi:hypothetical protein [Vibrio vulnificus YJ016]|uniref:Uncharacterized protein n=1 Tax=Vibrio vulnificus (strain YJ016) TaxID=196600 RepID=Q7MG18_VIBVY|nr:hypothetical protein [Vibrio vulnificus YJ016]